MGQRKKWLGIGGKIRERRSPLVNGILLVQVNS